MLEELPPFLGGGEMIADVRMSGSTYAALPHKYEAGTPPIAQAVGLGAAVDYLSALGMDAVAAHEQAITSYALERLGEIDGLTIVGPDSMVDRGGAVSFSLGLLHPHDVGQVLDEQGIAVRVGHHCAKPVCTRFGVPATTRASFYVYSSVDDVDALVQGLQRVKEYFGMTVDSMYQEIILDHYRNPQHKGLREPYDVEVHHVNPTCGDEVTLRLLLSDGSVEDISYDSIGCSISQASASVMSGLLRDRDIDEALGVQFLTLLQSRGEKSQCRARPARRRCRVRRCLAVSGTNQVRAAAVDGLEGRRAAGFGAVEPSSEARARGRTHGGSAPVSPRPQRRARPMSRDRTTVVEES